MIKNYARIMVAFAFGKGFILASQIEYHSPIANFLDDDIGTTDLEGKNLSELTFDSNQEDGVWTCKLKLEDDGPGDWPGTREVVVASFEWQRVTEEEWFRYLNKEQIWDDLPLQPSHIFNCPAWSYDPCECGLDDRLLEWDFKINNGKSR